MVKIRNICVKKPLVQPKYNMKLRCNPEEPKPHDAMNDIIKYSVQIVCFR